MFRVTPCFAALPAARVKGKPGATRAGSTHSAGRTDAAGRANQAVGRPRRGLFS